MDIHPDHILVAVAVLGAAGGVGGVIWALASQMRGLAEGLKAVKESVEEVKRRLMNVENEVRAINETLRNK